MPRTSPPTPSSAPSPRSTPAGDTHTFTLVAGTGSADNASFNISGTSLRTSAIFDFEVKPSYSIRVRATDQGRLTFEKQLGVTVTDVADDTAPVLAAIGAGDVAYSEQAPAVIITDTLTVTDSDDANLVSAQVRISAGFEAGDELTFTNQNGIIGAYDSGTGVLTLIGSSSLANYRDGVAEHQVPERGDETPSATRTVEFKVNDGDVDSDAITRGIAITPVNDARRAPTAARIRRTPSRTPPQPW